MSSYATLANIKGRLGITDTNDDAALASALAAASRWIDNYTHRRFYAKTETRYYTPVDSQTCFIDDVISITSLESDSAGNRTYATAWAATDYDLMPDNASVRGVPYTWIETAPNGNYYFSTLRRSLKIVGSFGYCALGEQPNDITEACLIAAMRTWKRKDAIFGVAGAPAFGVQVVTATIQNDADLISLLAPYKTGLIQWG